MKYLTGTVERVLRRDLGRVSVHAGDKFIEYYLV